MPLLASLRTGLAALCRKFIICIRLPDYAYYINGPETLPPPLSKEEEKVVFAGLEAGNPDCRDVLIVHNLRLVVYIAKKFESKTASVEDMISIGTIGLIKAVNTFVPSKNIKLATYASRCIENAILSPAHFGMDLIFALTYMAFRKTRSRSSNVAFHAGCSENTVCST